MIGQRLGHYRLVAEIGAGGMGVVYRAQDEHLDRQVAVKVLPPDVFADEAARKRFRKEALALAKLSNPYIAHVHDFNTEGGVDFLAMELVPGRSLAEALTSGALAERDALKLGCQLASALEEAHGQGIVHRDLKPGNLMVTPSGDLKVLDFGLAKLFREPVADATTVSGTEVGVVAGTVPYMAPEQLRAEGVDARTDIWAAGVVLYELTSGQKPFRGQVAASLTDAILNRAPEPPASVNRKLSAGFGQVVLKCLEKDPERRYQSAKELKVDLERLLNPSTASNSKPAPRHPLARWWPAAAGGALVALGIVVVVLKPWPGQSRAALVSSPIASLAVLPLANMTGDPGQEYFSDGMTEALITELAKIRSLKVTSRTSVMRLKKTDNSLPEIAKQLGVEGIVEGSVSRGAGRVKITAQLIRAATDTHLWADSFERQEADVLALQSEVAEAIAERVLGALAPEEAGRVRPSRKVNPKAYDLVLQGFHLVKSGGDPDSLHRAIKLFEKAVALDPRSAEAHAGLANALTTLAGYGFASYWDIYARATSELDAALALDPDYAWAFVARGDLLGPKDPRGALQAYHRAVQLDPENSMALYDYAYWLDILEPGPEGERLLRKAIEMDPLAEAPRCGLMGRLYVKRRYAEAEAEARRVLDLDPNWFWAWDQLWRIHVREGKLAEAQKESRRSWAIVFGDAFNPPPNLSWEAYQRWLDRFLAGQQRSWVPGMLAANLARRGERAKALEYLKAAAEGNSGWMGQLDYPDFDSIRDDPQFQKIVEERKLPAASFCRIPPGEGRT